MKVIIQIPCFCEEESLPVTLAALPASLPGVDCVEWLVVDDGSTDRTVEAAERFGVDHVVRLSRHQGLARAFTAGIEFALRKGADIIVNTDADNQYCAEDIEELVSPILANKADIVIGSRPIDQTAHFSPTKRALQKIGSWVVRRVSGTDVVDAPSGFRAFSREAALSLHVFSHYSYTIETIVQAKLNNFRILSVPVRTQPELRPSRLSSGVLQYVCRSTETLFRIFVVYYPFRFFLLLSTCAFVSGLIPGIRYLYYESMHKGDQHIQSLVFCVIFSVLSFLLFSMALLGDAVAVNRKLMEKVDLALKDSRSQHRTKEEQWEIKSVRAGSSRAL